MGRKNGSSEITSTIKHPATGEKIALSPADQKFLAQHPGVLVNARPGSAQGTRLTPTQLRVQEALVAEAIEDPSFSRGLRDLLVHTRALLLGRLEAKRQLLD